MRADVRGELIDSVRGGRLSRRDAVRLGALLGLGAGAAACAPVSGGGRTLRVHAQLIDFRDIHSNSSTTANSIVNPALDYLCVIDPAGVTRGSLVERWTPSEDLRTWTLHLRRDVRWLKGGVLTADEVLWNLWRWLDPAIGSSYLGLVTGYLMTAEPRKPGAGGPAVTWRPWDANAFEKVDDFTIRMNLKRPVVTVAEDFTSSSCFIVDPKEGGEFKSGCNGTGPFECAEYRVNDVAIYKARADSWRGRPAVERLEIVDAGTDSAVIAAALVANQIQGVMSLSAENAAVFRDSPDIRLYRAQSAQTDLIRVHCDVKPFDDPRVRRAMRLSVDAGQALKLVLGEWGSGGQHDHVSPAQPDCGFVAPPRYDLAEARRLMAEAGLAKGFKTRIVVSSLQRAGVKLAQVVAEMWRLIGIDAAIDTLPQELYSSHWRDYPLSVTGWGHRPLAVVTMALSYRTGSLWNESRYSNPEVDALIDQALLELDPQRRAGPISEIQRLLQEDGPLVQPFFLPTTAAFHRDVGGVVAHPMAYYPAERLGYRA